MDLPAAQYSVFGGAFMPNELIQIDLTERNTLLKNINLDNQQEFELFVRTTILNSKSKAAWGGYLENRVIYRRSPHFSDAINDRCIHLGIDVWMPEGTPVYSPLDGIVHSCGINDNYADYGGTLILQHKHVNNDFYTLYGHLSHESIRRFSSGEVIKAGNLIASLGNWQENGNWPPHLHFQVILDMMSYSGDFPGVCSEKDVNLFQRICPNPSQLMFEKNCFL